jgi:hypothetical protein
LFGGRDAPPSSEQITSAASRLQGIGLDGKAAKALASYVADGLNQQREFSEMKVVQMCRRKAAITSKTQVADAFVDIYHGLDSMQSKLWGGFPFLDANNRRILSSYAAKRRLEIPISPSDPRRAFEQSPETLDQLLARICRGK